MTLQQRLALRANRHQARGGTALAIAVLAVSVVAMLGAGFLQVSSALVKRQAGVVSQQQAFYLAEAGLAESFQAVRMGRTGQVGSETSPAAFGQGLIWVDVVELADGSLRLDSTGLCGTGRSRLSLVVEPVDLGLGFFADEDLVLDSVVLVDGWDSGEVTYAEAVGGTWPSVAEVQDYVDVLVGLVGNGTVDNVVTGPDIDPTMKYSGNLGSLSVAQLEEAARWQPALRLAYPSGYNKLAPDPSYPAGQPISSAPPADSDAAASGTSGPASELGVTTGSGARLGSNGDVQFAIPSGEVAEVWGDVLPGPNGAVTGLDNVSVTGSVESRGSTVELPTVQLPSVARLAPVRHDDLLPMLISAGTSGHERIEVAAGAELVIRGPATVLIDSLVLEPTALLTLDTRAGEVALFITGSIDLQAGSIVETSGVRPDETSVQVSSTSNDPLNPAVNLDATSQFYGTIYAPQTDVHLGADFEVFGGVVARRLDVSAGARLHFDGSGVIGSALPRIIGWRVVEVPPAIRALRGDLIAALGLDDSDVLALSEAHDLGSVQMDLTYIDTTGIERTYSGQEDQFDWSQATAVVLVERNATRPSEDGAAQGADPAPTDDVELALADLAGPALKTELLSLTPLPTDAAILFMDSQKLSRADTKEILIASEPLEDPSLEVIVSGRSVLGRTEALDLLLRASPLSPAMLDTVFANAANVFGTAELQAIRDANL